MASWHRGADAALETDIEALAKTVSAFVVTSVLPGAIRSDTIEALRATERSSRNAPGAKGRVSTLIIPHDRSWEPFGIVKDGKGNVSFNLMDDSDDEEIVSDSKKAPSPEVIQTSTKTTKAFLDSCATALVDAHKGKVAVYCGGEALLATDGALQAVGAITEILGGELLCENNFSRVDRGNDLPHPKRLPYFPKDAAAQLSKYEVVVCVDVKRPIAMFGYENSGPSHLLRLNEEKIWDLDVGGGVLSVAEISVLLRDAVARKLGREIPTSATTNQNAYWTVPPRSVPKLPSMTQKQKLTPDSMCTIIAALQPANCVVVDESLTSGTNYWDRSAGCQRFAHLTLTGGAIGFGPCASLGAAVALEQESTKNTRYVINIQSDGCAAYAPQALWTQAKEKLNVVTVICANRRYAILELEKMMQRTNTGTPATGSGKGAGMTVVGNPASNSTPPPTEPASKRLTSLQNPHVEWTKVASGFGVFSEQVSSPDHFATAFQNALRRKGPTLIEALLL